MKLKRWAEKGLKFDWLLFLLVIFLVVFGCVMVHSASMISAELYYKDEFFFVKKQIIGGVIGLALMLVFYLLDYHYFTKFRWAILIGGFVLLGLVFIPGLGVESYGAKRWINLGITTIQPSELAKFAFVVFASVSLAKNYNSVKSIKGVLPTVIVGGLICIMIILEPNMSITMVVGLTMLVMLYVGGIKLKHFAVFLIFLAITVPVLIIMEPYRLRRLTAFLNPWANSKDEGFQLVQSLYSLGNGGLFGVGIGNSRQKYLFLPFAESDFIFSIIGEELGFLGASVICIIYVLIIIRGIKIAINAGDRLGALLASGITSIIAIQFFINIAVVTSSIPPTGLPLPFISAGSTSLVVFMGAIGVLERIYAHSKRQKFQYNFK